MRTFQKGRSFAFENAKWLSHNAETELLHGVRSQFTITRVVNLGTTTKLC